MRTITSSEGTTLIPLNIELDTGPEIIRDLPKGVRLRKGRSKPYEAQASYKGKKYMLGCYETPEEASEVYKKFRAEH